MIVHLTDDQRRAIEEHGGTPIPLLDEATDVSYILMRADQFERVRALLEEEDSNPREAYPFIDEVMREDDLLDPTLGSYGDRP